MLLSTPLLTALALWLGTVILYSSRFLRACVQGRVRYIARPPWRRPRVLFSQWNPPPYNNPTFINAFVQSFTSFAINLDPNIKVDPTTITPRWNPYVFSNTEMLFNRTAAGVPVVRPFTTSNELLLRCQ
ncbi:hypothetical protein C8J57DRAFT_1539031 [Mycena rebaudengoi]|nr:hypothetical protein C8J57DRAFT_1539031 [Mycena rebaudengoi]